MITAQVEVGCGRRSHSKPFAGSAAWVREALREPGLVTTRQLRGPEGHLCVAAGGGRLGTAAILKRALQTMDVEKVLLVVGLRCTNPRICFFICDQALWVINRF